MKVRKGRYRGQKKSKREEGNGIGGRTIDCLVWHERLLLAQDSSLQSSLEFPALDVFHIILRNAHEG